MAQVRKKTRKIRQPSSIRKGAVLSKLVKQFAKKVRAYRRGAKQITKQSLKHKRKLVRFLDRHDRALTIIGLILGIHLILFGSWFWLYSRTVLSFQVAPVVIQDVGGHQPAQVVIESLGVDLPLLSVEIQDGIWPTSLDSANHLATSAKPGQPSNIVVYGHNRPHLFKPLHELALGDEIELRTQTGRVFTYQVESIHIVSPSEIELVLPTEDEVLTIYTCTGWFDSKRLVVRALPL